MVFEFYKYLYFVQMKREICYLLRNAYYLFDWPYNDQNDLTLLQVYIVN